MNNNLATITEIIEEAKKGNIFILIDDENRENEGDLIIPAQNCNKDIINFMAKYGRGLICLALDEDRVNQLELPLMSLNNESRNKTAFTISIEAREGITTGISAADRAITIRDAIDPNKNKDHIVSPGHIFPLKAAKGGVLVRAGHTEAAVDIAKMANLNPSGVICEIMNDDGTMARLPDLMKFSKQHDIKIATIADLIQYRRQNEKLIEVTQKSKFNNNYGEFDITIYRSLVDDIEHIALTKGDIKNSKEPILVRMHHLNILSDCLLDSKNPKTNNLSKSLEHISKNKLGACVIIRQPFESINDLFYNDNINHEINKQKTLRNYGIGAQILNDLGIKKMTLLTNSKKSIIGLKSYDIDIVDYKKI